jgi:hypothetical protein
MACGTDWQSVLPSLLLDLFLAKGSKKSALWKTTFCFSFEFHGVRRGSGFC